MWATGQVTVLILNWNGRSLLEQYLPAVVSHSGQAKIVVADNGSTDDSIAYLSDSWPQIEIWPLGHNYGFAEGYNKAIEMVATPWVLLLNSDVAPQAGYLATLISFLSQNPKVAAVQPKVVSDTHPHLFEYAGACGGYLDYLGYSFCRGRLFDFIEADKGQYETHLPIHWASGAALLIKTELYKNLGGLEGRFFAHFEEIDLCWRMVNRGHLIYVVPESKVRHLGGATLNYGSPQKTYLNFRNNLASLIRNYRGNNFWGVLLLRLTLDGVAGIKFLMALKPLFCWAIIKAHFSVYGWLPWLLAFRKEEKKYGQNPSLPLWDKSILYQFFVKKTQTFSGLRYEPNATKVP